jgi:hypothetical protein
MLMYATKPDSRRLIVEFSRSTSSYSDISCSSPVLSCQKAKRDILAHNRCLENVSVPAPATTSRLEPALVALRAGVRHAQFRLSARVLA